MSSTDNRIVQMQFDNAQFEANVKNTMRSLEQLEDSLQLTGATRGMDRVASESKTLCKSMDSVGSAVETVKMQFSALQIAGVVAMSKLTLAAIDVGKKINNAIFGQIVSGGIKRSQNIENAKFQLEGLGVAWEKIYDDIDYGVKDTAYGLDEAARVASQLVASLDLSEAGYTDDMSEQMKRNLRAISGVAAMTNSSYAEIGDIFTTVASNGKLMTMQLRQLAARGLNVSAQLARAFNVTEEEMNKMVTQGKISFTDFANAMDEAFGEHAKEANKTFSGAMSNVRAALSRIGQKFADPVFENLRKVLNSVRLVINDINAALKPVYEMVQGIIEAIAGNMIALMDQGDFVEGLQYLALALYSYVRPFIAAMQELGLFTLSDMPTMASNFLEFAKSIQLYGEKAEAVKNIIKGIINIFRLMWEVASGIFHAISPLIQEVARALGLMTGESSTLFGYINDNYDVLVAIIRIISEFIRLKIVGVIQKIHGTLRALAARGINVHGVLQNILNTVIYLIVNLAVLISNSVSFVTYLLNNLPSIGDMLTSIVMLAAGAAATIGSFFTDVFSSIFGGSSNTTSFRVETEVGETSEMNAVIEQSPEVQDSLDEMANTAEESGKRTERAMKGASDAADEYADRMDRATRAVEKNAEAQENLHRSIDDVDKKKKDENTRFEEATSSKTTGITGEALKESMFARSANADETEGINIFFKKILDALNIGNEHVRDAIFNFGDILNGAYKFVSGAVIGVFNWLKLAITNPLEAFMQLMPIGSIIAAIAAGIGLIKLVGSLINFLNTLPTLAKGIANIGKGKAYEGLSKVILSLSVLLFSITACVGVLGYISSVVDPERLKSVVDALSEFCRFLIRITAVIAVIVGIASLSSILASIASLKKGTGFYRNFSLNLSSFSSVLYGIGIILAELIGVAIWIANDKDRALEAFDLVIEYLRKILITIGGFLAIMSIVTLVTKQVSAKFTTIANMGTGIRNRSIVSPMTQMIGLLLAITPLIIATTIALKVLSNIDPIDLRNGGIALGAILFTITLVMSILIFSFSKMNYTDVSGSGMVKNLNGLKDTLTAMVPMLLGITASLAVLAYINTEMGGLVEPCVALASMLVVIFAGLSIMMGIFGKIGFSKVGSVDQVRNLNQLRDLLIGVSILLGTIAAVMLVANYIDESAMYKTINIVIIAMSFITITTFLLAGINKLLGSGTVIGSSMVFFVGLTLIIAAIAVLMYVIGTIDWESSLQVMPYILGLVALLIGLAAVLALLTMFKAAWVEVLVATLGMAAIIGMLAVLVYTIGQVNWSKIEEAIPFIDRFLIFFGLFSVVLLLLVAMGGLCPAANVALALVLGIILAMGVVVAALAVAAYAIGEAAPKIADAIRSIMVSMKEFTQTDFDSVSDALTRLTAILWEVITVGPLALTAAVVAGLLGFGFSLLATGIGLIGLISPEAVDAGINALSSFMEALNDIFDETSMENVGKIMFVAAILSLGAILFSSGIVLLAAGILVGSLLLVGAGAILYYGGDLIRLGGEKLIEVLTALAPQFEENAEAMNSACGALILFGVELMGAGLMMTIGGALLLVGAAAVVVASAFLAYALGAMSEAVNGEEINNILDNIGNFMLLSTYVTMLGVALSVGSAFFIAGALLLLVGVKIFNSAIEELQEELFALDVIAEHMAEIGECIPMGLVEGLINKSDLFYQAMQDLGTNAINIFNNRMGIHSPSEEMRASGHWMMAGIVEGIEDKWPNLAQGLANLANLIPTTINNNLDMSSVSNNIANAGSTGGVGFINNLSGVFEDGANNILIPGAWDTGNLMGQAMSQAMMEQFSGTMNSIAATFNHYSNGMDLDKIAGQNSIAALEAWKGTQAAVDSGAIEEIPAAGLGTISLDQLDLSDFLNTKSSGSPGGSPVATDDLDFGNIGGGGGGGGGSSGITTDDLISSISSNSGAGTGINDLSQGGTNINSNNTYNFTQNNYSPKELDRTELYEQTNYQLKRWYGWMQSNA